ncbi:MAG: hypothetical protein RSC24_06510 [Clostridium sp.]
MKKSDLKSGMIVEILWGDSRRSVKYILLEDRLVGLRGWGILDNYDENLINKEVKAEISKVYLNKTMTRLEDIDYSDGLELLWEREREIDWSKKEIFEIIEEDNNMKELTFREVIANIKEGEVWEGYSENIIGLDDVRFKIEWKKGLRDVINPSFVYRLKRNKVSFQEAFKAYEEGKGKEIESCVTNCKYKKEGNVELFKEEKDEEWEPWNSDACFETREIRGEWYIN